jgi:hypothetical protein
MIPAYDPHIARAAACLRDDPTFKGSPRAEQEEEARAVLAVEGGDPEDPLDVALTIEAALQPAPDPTPGELAAYLKPTVGATHRAIVTEASPLPVTPLEACRENKDAPGRPCAAPVGATGRCQDCGAFRHAVATASLVAAPAPLAARSPEPVTDDKPETHYVRRAKEVMGWPDHHLAVILKKSRATIQAYAGGRLPERLTLDQYRALDDAISRQIVEMQAILAGLRSPEGL